MRRLKIFLLILISIGSTTLSAQPVERKIAVLPFTSAGVDSISVITADAMIRLEFSKIDSIELIPKQRIISVLSETDCILSDKECVISVGKQLDADEILSGNFSALGEKIIVQYYLLNVQTSENIIVDQITAANVEDLEEIVKRIAKSVSEKISINENVEVGQVTETESKNLLRRGSNKNFGVSFGYLYPSHGYDDSNKSLVFDLRYGFELDEAAIGLMLGIRKGFAMNVYGHYLFTKTDFCPYLGGALGFHWISHDFFSENADGFEFSLNAGIRAFRTYSFEVLLNFEYIMTFNKFNDKAFVFTIGIL